jgi:hypothetical protein
MDLHFIVSILTVILGLIVLLFIWLVAPAVILEEKGRRWKVWLPISLLLPVGFLFLAIFMHGTDEDGSYIMS